MRPIAGERPKMVTRRLGQLVILAQGKEAPRDFEWRECLKLVVATDDINSTRVLVVTEGGGPSTAQRKALESVLRGTRICSAVVSDSVRVRFIVATVALFGPNISTFSMSEIHKAYEFLGLTRAQIALAEKALAEMRVLLA